MLEQHRYSWSGESPCQFFVDEALTWTLLPCSVPDVVCTDEITESEPGVFLWKRSCTYTGTLTREVSGLAMELQVQGPATYWLIPGVSYNGNTWGSGLEPKLAQHNGEPWSFASHRTTVAGATYSEGEALSTAMFGISGWLRSFDSGEIGFSCSLSLEEDHVVHRLVWPEWEAPKVYAARDQYEDSFEERLLLQSGDTLDMTAYLIAEPVAVAYARHAWHKLLDVAWRRNYHQVPVWHEPERIWELGVQFARESLWVEDGVYRGFAWGLHRANGGWEPKRDWPYEIGWVGQNASLANSLLADYVKTGRSESLQKGLLALDTWAAYAPLPNGLFRCRFQHIVEYPLDTAKSGKEVQDACNLSAVALQYFEAARLTEACGQARPGYTDIALGVCNFALRAQSASGRFGKSWHNDETIADPEGTIGCFLVPPLLEAYRLTQDGRYLDSAIRGYHHYIADFIAQGFSTAGALDTYCIDKESAIPLLQGGLELYELTHEPKYLDYAVLASHYIASWQMHHTVRFPLGTALHELGYDTFGGTTVSTQHHHIDHFALSIVPEWLRLAAHTGDDTWKQRALAAWANATAVISDGSLSVSGGPVRPAGGQDEGFCHTRWHTRWGEYFGVSQWLVAWPTAFRLEVLRSADDWTPFMSN